MLGGQWPEQGCVFWGCLEAVMSNHQWWAEGAFHWEELLPGLCHPPGHLLPTALFSKADFSPAVASDNQSVLGQVILPEPVVPPVKQGDSH